MCFDPKVATYPLEVTSVNSGNHMFAILSLYCAFTLFQLYYVDTLAYQNKNQCKSIYDHVGLQIDTTVICLQIDFHMKMPITIYKSFINYNFILKIIYLLTYLTAHFQ